MKFHDIKDCNTLEKVYQEALCILHESTRFDQITKLIIYDKMRSEYNHRKHIIVKNKAQNIKDKPVNKKARKDDK